MWLFFFLLLRLLSLTGNYHFIRNNIYTYNTFSLEELKEFKFTYMCVTTTTTGNTDIDTTVTLLHIHSINSSLKHYFLLYY